MTLAERFARTQGWVFPEDGGWQPPPGEPFATFPTIDVNILPIIWADCKTQEWGCKMEYTPWLEPAGHSATVCVDPGWKEYKVFSDDPVAALCGAYCSAKEATE